MNRTDIEEAPARKKLTIILYSSTNHIDASAIVGINVVIEPWMQKKELHTRLSFSIIYDSLANFLLYGKLRS